MPRRPRIIVPGAAMHVIQRGNNRQACFFADEDYRFYLDWLKEYTEQYYCSIHAYVLMSNHVHLLLTPAKSDSCGQLMKRLGQRYVQYVNRTYRRSGTLWEGRFRSSVIQEDLYLLRCQRYIEMNPVRAGMVDHPGAYPWSSYSANGQGIPSSLLTPHPLYLGLAAGTEEQQAAYRELFRHELEPGVIDTIREATNGNFVCGNNRFQEEIAAVLGRRVSRGKAGRPKTTGSSDAARAAPAPKRGRKPAVGISLSAKSCRARFSKTFLKRHGLTADNFRFLRLGYDPEIRCIGLDPLAEKGAGRACVRLSWSKDAGSASCTIRPLLNHTGLDAAAVAGRYENRRLQGPLEIPGFSDRGFLLGPITNTDKRNMGP